MKRIFIAIFAILMVLTLSACGRTNPPQASPSIAPSAQPKTSPSAVPSASPNASAIVPPIAAGVFDSTAFAGKIHNCAYAADQRVMVLADQMSLYDTQTGEVMATATIGLRDASVYPFADGYLVVGYGENGISGVLYDGLLGSETPLAFTEWMGEDMLASVDGVSISPDGGTIALAGLNGLYLYDMQRMERSTLLTYEENTQVNNMRISLIGSLSFIHEGQKLAYIGEGFPLPTQDGDNGFPIYGMVSINGDNLTITKNTAYAVEELFACGNQIIMPQDSRQSDGTLLTMDAATEEEAIIRFSTPDEGEHGVFASAKGQYVATAVVTDELTIRVYAISTGELLHTQVVSHENSTYFNRIPRLLILDESRTCIALLGSGIDEVDTLIVPFHFEES